MTTASSSTSCTDCEAAVRCLEMQALACAAALLQCAPDHAQSQLEQQHDRPHLRLLVDLVGWPLAPAGTAMPAQHSSSSTCGAAAPAGPTTAGGGAAGAQAAEAPAAGQGARRQGSLCAGDQPAGVAVAGLPRGPASGGRVCQGAGIRAPAAELSFQLAALEVLGLAVVSSRPLLERAVALHAFHHITSLLLWAALTFPGHPAVGHRRQQQGAAAVLGTAETEDAAGAAAAAGGSAASPAVPAAVPTAGAPAAAAAAAAPPPGAAAAAAAAGVAEESEELRQVFATLWGWLPADVATQQHLAGGVGSSRTLAVGRLLQLLLGAVLDCFRPAITAVPAEVAELLAELSPTAAAATAAQLQEVQGGAEGGGEGPSTSPERQARRRLAQQLSFHAVASTTLHRDSCVLQHLTLELAAALLGALQQRREHEAAAAARRERQGALDRGPPAAAAAVLQPEAAGAEAHQGKQQGKQAQQPQQPQQGVALDALVCLQSLRAAGLWELAFGPAFYFWCQPALVVSLPPSPPGGSTQTSVELPPLTTAAASSSSSSNAAGAGPGSLAGDQQQQQQQQQRRQQQQQQQPPRWEVLELLDAEDRRSSQGQLLPPAHPVALARLRAHTLAVVELAATLPGNRDSTPECEGVVALLQQWPGEHGIVAAACGLLTRLLARAPTTTLAALQNLDLLAVLPRLLAKQEQLGRQQQQQALAQGRRLASGTAAGGEEDDGMESEGEEGVGLAGARAAALVLLSALLHSRQGVQRAAVAAWAPVAVLFALVWRQECCQVALDLVSWQESMRYRCRERLRARGGLEGGNLPRLSPGYHFRTRFLLSPAAVVGSHPFAACRWCC